MVVFTCNNCGDSVKKPKVDKHLSFECRRKCNAVSLCCIDCLKDFDAKTYPEHTKCVSELERYSAPGLVLKTSANKGEMKQNTWMDVIRTVLNKPNLTNSQRTLLVTLANYENVPRKKSKFENFLRNSSRGPTTPKVIDEVFELLETEFKGISKQRTVNKEMSSTEERSVTDQIANTLKEFNQMDSIMKSSDSDVKFENTKKTKKARKAEADCNVAEEKTENSHPSVTKLMSSYTEETLQSDHVSKDDNCDIQNEINPVASKKRKKKQKNKVERIDGAIYNEVEENSQPSVSEEVNTEKNFDLLNEKDAYIMVQNKKKKSKTHQSGSDSIDNVTKFTINGNSHAEIEKKNFQVSEQSCNDGNVPLDDDEMCIFPKKERKKKKFQKFRNITNDDTSEANVLENSQTVSCGNDCIPTANEGIAGTSEKKRKKKRKLEDATDDCEVSKRSRIENDQNCKNESTKFNWDYVVKTFLEKSKEGEMSLKRMTKKVVAEYQSTQTREKSFDEIAKQFHKKVKKLPFVVVAKDRVQLYVQ